MNTTIFFFFYNLAHKSDFLDQLIIFFAVYFPYIVIFLAFVFLLFHHEILFSKSPFQEFKKKWLEFLLVFFSAGFAWIISQILKILIHTPRPFDVFSQVRPLFAETGYTFPSGHATFFMALAVSLFFCHKKVGYFFIFFAIIIGFARIVGGVHFPIDILGGFILGALVVLSVKKLLL